jgi:plasmid stabilization system protein ParE
MPRIEWTEAAVRDLFENVDRLRLSDPVLAVDEGDRVQRFVGTLPTQPDLGRSGRVHGTREVIVPGCPVIACYASEGDVITILRLIDRHPSIEL